MSSLTNGSSTSGTSYPNTGAQSTLGNLGQSPTAGQNVMNTFLEPSANQTTGTTSPMGTMNGNVGDSSLGGGLISASGAPMTMYQMLLQSGRATSGY